VLKGYFKGDPEFTYENFHRLPYEYVLSAYWHCARMSQIESHKNERPIAMLAAQQANLNRDHKKRKTPFEMEDFYLYQPKEFKNAPAERYGAAALWLIENKLYPTWALFCFKELNKNRGKNIPTLVAFLHPNAVILAPTVSETAVTGFLMAEHCVSNQILEMTSPCGQTVKVKIPAVRDEVAAEENISLPLC
jgi:hypothetical protein